MRGIELVGDRPRGVRAAAGGRLRPSRRRRPAAGRSSLSRSGTTARRSRSPTASVCDFTRVLEWGGAKLESAIARDLGVTPDEAHELKHDALARGRPRSATTDSRQAAVREALRRELQTLARELVASLQFYQTQPGSLAISRDPRHGRHQPPARAAGGARAPDARERPRAPIRSPTCRRPTACGRATTWLPSRSRSGWGWRSDARRQPAPPRRSPRQPPDHRRPRGPGAPRPLPRGLAAGVLALLVTVLASISAASSAIGVSSFTTSRPGSSPPRRVPPSAGGPGRHHRQADRLPDGRRPAARLGRRPPRPLAGPAGERLAVEPHATSPTLTAGAASAPAVPVAAAPRRPRRRSGSPSPARRLAGPGRTGARPACTPPLAVERDAPVERARWEQARPCSSRSERPSAPLEVDHD